MSMPVRIQLPPSRCTVGDLKSFLDAIGYRHLAKARVGVNIELPRTNSHARDQSAFTVSGDFPTEYITYFVGRVVSEVSITDGRRSFDVAVPRQSGLDNEFEGVLQALATIQNDANIVDFEDSYAETPVVRRWCNARAFSPHEATTATIDIRYGDGGATMFARAGSDDAGGWVPGTFPIHIGHCVLVEAKLRHTGLTDLGPNERSYSILARRVKIMQITGSIPVEDVLEGLSNSEDVSAFLSHPIPSPDDSVRATEEDDEKNVQEHYPAPSQSTLAAPAAPVTPPRIARSMRITMGPGPRPIRTGTVTVSPTSPTPIKRKRGQTVPNGW
ncbi:hypothetical protein C8J57DRAFT_1540382 [Mycena rebaudengoi]|nr:hypothetical protein C8J57DRAFT_1540382 [Mycena rebaudengoi]